MNHLGAGVLRRLSGRQHRDPELRQEQPFCLRRSGLTLVQPGGKGLGLVFPVYTAQPAVSCGAQGPVLPGAVSCHLGVCLA